MARRRIGQEQLVIDDRRASRGSSLEQMSALINWSEIDLQFDEISIVSRRSRLAAIEPVQGHAAGNVARLI